MIEKPSHHVTNGAVSPYTQTNGITARPRADNSRDAMFRAGVAAGLAAAAAGGASAMARLGGDTPAAFVSGLAEALEVDDASAWTIVHAAVAARGRSTLTDALAAQLRDDSGAVRSNGCQQQHTYAHLSTCSNRSCRSCWRCPTSSTHFPCHPSPPRQPWWARQPSSVRACSFARQCF